MHALCVFCVYSGDAFMLSIQAIHSGYLFRLFIQAINSGYLFRLCQRSQAFFEEMLEIMPKDAA